MPPLLGDATRGPAAGARAKGVPAARRLERFPNAALQTMKPQKPPVRLSQRSVFARGARAPAVVTGSFRRAAARRDTRVAAAS